MAVPVQETIGPRRKPLSNWFIGKAFIICLSFASLSFLNVWEDLLDHQPDFFRKYAVTWQQLAAVTLDVLLLAVVLWIPVCLVARSGNRTWVRILKWCILAGLMLPLSVLRFLNGASAVWTLPAPVRILLEVLAAAAGIVLLWKWERLSTLVTSTILVILAPMLPLVIASVAWSVYTGPPAGRFPDKPPVGALLQKAGAPHVLWFIFDEWDESLTFRHRPANLELPELDRFRGQSFHADQAYPPAGNTGLSIPSLLAGKTFIAKETSGANELLLTYHRGQPPERLSSESTVFPEARSGGFNVGIVGFYLPYCRMFDTTSCEWQCAIGFLPVEWGYPLSVGRFMVLTAKRQALYLPFARRLGVGHALGDDPLQPSLHAVTYRQTQMATLHSIVDSRLNLVFVHSSIPHPPTIYDAKKDVFSNGSPHYYEDNLRLLDRTVRDIRLTLEKAGLWDSSTILMTSDHSLRFDWGPATLFPAPLGKYTRSEEVPYLLKLAGQKRGFAYNSAIQTVVTKDLLLAIMKGEITQPEQAAAWLDHNPPRR
jgi:hypothetical protein